MAEATARFSTSWLLRRSRLSLPRCGKSQYHMRRHHATAAAAPARDDSTYNDPIPWTPHVPQPTNTPRPGKSRLEALRASDPKPFSSFLTDTHSRQHTYLRISLTERCNLRCVYCMPENGVPLSPQSDLLTTPEIVHLSSLFVSEGVNKIRLTGGEPTVRKDIVPLMQQIGDLRRHGLKELCITTNGLALYRKLDAMAEAGLTGVNLSLDTLDPYQFQIMTRRLGHDKVLKSIDRILEMNRLGAGIKLKINIVIMRGINDREILDFVDLGREQDLEVRFIEYMPFDGNKWSQKKMVSYTEMLNIISERYPNLQKVQDHKNDTSKTYQVPGFAGKMGFITSMTHNFCGTCNRLRITSDGNLKVCLFGNAEVSLRDIIRESNSGQPIDEKALEALEALERDATFTHTAERSIRDNKLLEVIGMAVKRKKEKHAGMGELENMKNRPMILIDEVQPIGDSWRVYQGRSRSASGMALNRGYQHVPTHLLASSSTSPSGLRFFSTTSYRAKQDSDDSISKSDSSPTSSPTTFTHLTDRGHAHMVDISAKKPTQRLAKAMATVHFSNPEPMRLLLEKKIPKGDALAVARIGGIMAVKKTAELIVLCHPSLAVESCSVDLEIIPSAAATITNEEEKMKKSNMKKRIDPGQTWGKYGQFFQNLPIDPTPPTVNTSTKTSTSTRNSTSSSPSSSTSPSSPYGGLKIVSTVSCSGKTGIEMEALTSALVAALNVVDMVKGVDKGVYITEARIVEKRGGKSGTWIL